MKIYIKKTILMIIFLIISVIIFRPIQVSAWGDNYGGDGRPSYTIDEINKGAIGATELSDGLNYKNNANYPGKIVFNSISNSVIGDEKNFVGARKCILREDGTGEEATKETIWKANEIQVEDGGIYFIRLYVHNNNPNGEDAVAENTKVRFNVPVTSGKEVQVRGYITSTNAAPTEYLDHVSFVSDIPFHLKYIHGSALLESNVGDFTLSDDIVEAKKGGVLIGYDKLDGRIPGCYQYDSYVSIKVEAKFDYEFTVETKVRVVGDTDQTWKKTVEAKIGDKIEFLIQYKNTSNQWQNNVAVKDILPNYLRYVEGSTKLKNGSHPNTDKVDDDYLITAALGIGNYDSQANAYLMFIAEVVDDGTMNYGSNTLVNWAQVGVDGETKQDYARVHVEKNMALFNTITITFCVAILICIVFIILILRKMLYWKQMHR